MTGRMRRLWRTLSALPAGRWLDAAVLLVTAVLFAVAWPTLHLTHDVPAPVQPLIAGLAALPFLLVRANPALGWSISAAGALVVPIVFDRLPGWGYPWQVVHLIVLMTLLLAVALRCALPVVAVAWGATALLFLASAPGGEGWVVGLGALVVFGLLARWLVLSRRELARQEEVTEVERARRAVLEERARIARDLHDIVAHHMSMVVVQAQSAQYRLGGLPDEAKAEFDSIGATAREALNEIRGMLGVLRSDGVGPDRAPLPGLDRIDELVDGSRRAGMIVTLSRLPIPQISDSAGVAVYRILQESLSNAARHAPGAAVRVALGAEAGAVVLTVVNDAVAGPEDPNKVGGHGVAGMKDRARSVGGELSARSLPDGRFEVRARIPVPAPRDAPAPTVIAD